jgi:hypothetical protein
MRLLVLLFALAMNTFAAGPIMFGVRGGIPFNTTDSVAGRLGGFSSTRFEVGPTVGVRLPLGLAVEGDALFHREALNLGSFAGFNANTNSDSWQFPVMLKFTAGRQAIAPVLGAGAVVRHMNNFSQIPAFLLSGATAANTVGFVAGGGVRFRAGKVEITPEVRYTRWGGDSFSQSLLNFLPLSRNEASFLLGVTF